VPDGVECLADEVRQPATDLCWMRCPLEQTWNGSSCEGAKTPAGWCDASGNDVSGYCSTTHDGTDLCELTLGEGYRLPTRDEFVALLGNCVDQGTSYECDECDGGDGQTTCTDMFTSDDGYYWSSTPSGSYGAWYADFDLGSVYGSYADFDSYVRCVRGPDWATIPAGSFWMGSPDGDCPADYPGGTGCTSELGSQTIEDLHYVTLTTSFELGRYEVTQGEFAALMGWNPSYFGPNGAGADCGLDCPVEYVSWYDSIAYANELSSSESRTPCYTLTNIVCEDSTNVGTNAFGCMNNTQGGINAATVALNGVTNPYLCTGYRLPTESEWEYAIRAGSLTAFYPSDGNDGSITNTNQDPNLDQIGWYYYNSDTGSGRMTHPVGGKESNAWGLSDMSGNVWEWVWDWYLAAYPSGGTSSPVVDPVGGPPASCRVIRGGYWSYSADSCRSGDRDDRTPGGRLYSFGFRLARTIP